MSEPLLVEDDVRLNVTSDGKRFRCLHMREGPVFYPEIKKGIEVVRRKTIMSDMQSYIGKPAVIEHVDVRLNTDDPKIQAVKFGEVDGVGFDSTSGWFYCDGVITNPELAAMAVSLNPSSGYRVVTTGCGGRWNNVPYEREITKIEFHHLALCKGRSRYEESDFRLNAITNETGTLTMKLKFWQKDPAKPDVAPAAVEHDLPAETSISVGGKDVRLNALVEAHEQQEKEKADAAARLNAVAPAINDETELLVGGKPVKVSTLRASYEARENSVKEAKAKADAEGRENATRAAGDNSFRQLEAARGSNAGSKVTLAPSSGSIDEQMARGAERYGTQKRN